MMIGNKIFALIFIICNVFALKDKIDNKEPDIQAKNLEIKKLKRTHKWFNTKKFKNFDIGGNPGLKDSDVSSSNINDDFSIKRFDEPLTGLIDNNSHEGNFQVDDLNSLATNFNGQTSKKERMEFHVHGHLGPKTYKWGFDTGEGKNRQMRFEEMDGNGLLKGHYGYYNKDGKFHMVHYNAHPQEGFHVE